MGIERGDLQIVETRKNEHSAYSCLCVLCVRIKIATLQASNVKDLQVYTPKATLILTQYLLFTLPCPRSFEIFSLVYLYAFQ